MRSMLLYISSYMPQLMGSNNSNNLVFYQVTIRFIYETL